MLIFAISSAARAQRNSELLMRIFPRAVEKSLNC